MYRMLLALLWWLVVACTLMCASTPLLQVVWEGAAAVGDRPPSDTASQKVWPHLVSVVIT